MWIISENFREICWAKRPLKIGKFGGFLRILVAKGLINCFTESKQGESFNFKEKTVLYWIFQRPIKDKNKLSHEIILPFKPSFTAIYFNFLRLALNFMRLSHNAHIFNTKWYLPQAYLNFFPHQYHNFNILDPFMS